MSKKIKSITFFDIKYCVSEVLKKRDVLATRIWKKSTIEIDKTMAKDLKSAVIFHECTKIVLVNIGEFNLCQNEEFVEKCSKAFHRLLKQNYALKYGKKIKSIIFDNVKYSILEKKLKKGILAKAIWKNSTISIDERMNQDLKKSVIFKECTQILLGNIGEKQLSQDEEFVSKISNAFFDLAKMNPKLIK